MPKLEAAEILTLINDPTITYIQIRLQKEAYVEELVKALRSSSTSRQRAILCYVLGSRRAKSALLLIMECLADPVSQVRSAAADALAKLQNPTANSTLYNAFLSESNPGTKSSLIYALGEAKYQTAVPTLIEALNDPDERVGAAAMWALGNIGTKETIHELHHALEKDSDEQTKTLIRKLIEEISNRKD